MLNDRHERIVLDISDWEVTECDFNKDIKISDYFHMTALKVRVKHLDHLLGLYVKAMGQDTVLRVEETKRPNMRAADFITDTFNPMERLQSELLDQGRKIDEMYDIIKKSLASQSFYREWEERWSEHLKVRNISIPVTKKITPFSLTTNYPTITMLRRASISEILI